MEIIDYSCQFEDSITYQQQTLKNLCISLSHDASHIKKHLLISSILG